MDMEESLKILKVCLGTHTHTYIYICMYVYIYIYMCMYMYVFYIKMSSCQPTANSQNRWSTGPVAHLGAWLCRGILGITQKSAAFSGRCLWAWPHGRIRDFGWGTGRN